MNSANTFAAVKTGIPYTAEQMSEIIYRELCQSQITDYAYGEDSEGNSLEIHWHSKFEQWQMIYRQNGQVSINYDGLHEHSLVYEEPSLLLSICQNLDVVDELEESLEIEQ